MSIWNKPAQLFSGLALALAIASGQSPTISAEALRHPMSRKVSNVLRKVTDSYLAGDDAAMNQQLRRAMELPEAAPFALKMKGLLDLNQKDFPTAQVELEQAAVALPWDAEAEGLLAYAYYCAGDSTAGANAAYQSLQVDPNQALAHMVIGLVQWKGERVDAGLRHLRTSASLGLLPAQVLLTKYYVRTGQTELAQQEWQLVVWNLDQIQDQRVRRDTQRWLVKQQGLGQSLLPRAGMRRFRNASSAPH